MSNTLMASAEALVSAALNSVESLLQTFSQSEGFGAGLLSAAFGDDIDQAMLQQVQQQLSAGNFSSLPQIEVRTRDELSGAQGAYVAQTNRIYVAQDFLAQASSSQVAAVLLEEIGHSLDAQLNASDSNGDEGAIFSALVRGVELSGQQLAELQQEQDGIEITIDGQVLQAEANTSVITGTAGNDVLTGTMNEDTLNGLAGDDRFDGLAGSDTISGGAGNDVLAGNAGDDMLKGNAGDDRLVGGMGADVLEGGSGNDTVDYRLSDTGVTIKLSDRVPGTGGEAMGDTFQSIENAIGSDEDDDIVGTDVSNMLTGGDGNDTISGLGGDDVLTGGDGFDRLLGDMGDDTLNGGMGDDNLFGDGGDDTLNGNAGNDRLLGGMGADMINGGSGFDIVDYRRSTAGVTLKLTNTTAATGGEAAGDTFSSVEGAYGSKLDDDITGTNQDNALKGRDGEDTLLGLGGDDFLTGDDGDDRLLGGDGDDILEGGLGRDLLRGGAGSDRFVYKMLESSPDSIRDFNSSDDTLDLIDLFRNIGYTGNDAIADGYLRYRLGSGKTFVEVDADGTGTSSDFTRVVRLAGFTDTNSLQIGSNVLVESPV